MPFWKKASDGSLQPVDESSLKDVEFKPEELEKKISGSIDSKLNDFQTKQTEAMKPLLEMAEGIKREREERVAAEKKAKETREAKERDERDDSVDFLLDPGKATRDVVAESLKPRDTLILNLLATNTIKDTLGDKEYYHGELKELTDKYISTIPLQQRANPETIMNCYKLACYDRQKEITEGKIKARNTSGIFEGGSTGAHSGKDSSESDGVMTADEKFVASKMGISDKDWMSSRKDLSFV